MSQQANSDNDQEMLEEYDFSGGVRGKYVSRFAEDAVKITLEEEATTSSPILGE